MSLQLTTLTLLHYIIPGNIYWRFHLHLISIIVLFECDLAVRIQTTKNNDRFSIQLNVSVPNIISV